MIHFSFNIGCSESKVIFKRRKKANMWNKNALQGGNVCSSCTSFRTNAVNTQKSPPWACDKVCAEAWAGRFSALNLPPPPLFAEPGPRLPLPLPRLPLGSLTDLVNHLPAKLNWCGDFKKRVKMVETVYDLCQPSMFTTMFPSKPGFKFFLSLR